MPYPGSGRTSTIDQAHMEYYSFTKLASSPVNFWAHYIIVIDRAID